MDDDPGLAGLSPEFQAMLGGLAGHTKAFAQLLEKRSGSSKEEKAQLFRSFSWDFMRIFKEFMRIFMVFEDSLRGSSDKIGTIQRR